MEDYGIFLKALTAATGIEFQPASEYDLHRLTSLGIPAKVLEFYASHAPARSLEHRIRLWSVDDVIEENTELMPGCYASQFGYFVFASTLSGDAFCFDTSVCDSDGNARIVLICHENVSEDTSADEITRLARPIAQDISAFLEQLNNNPDAL